MLVAALLAGAGLTLAALRMMAPSTLVTRAQAHIQKNGQTIETAWPRLDQKTQEMIKEAAKSSPDSRLRSAEKIADGA
ncbi:MAG: hypothetical protein POH28_15025 [Acidocella sp.]|nr:hypothetical protein [Acidocella sp.]